MSGRDQRAAFSRLEAFFAPAAQPGTTEAVGHESVAAEAGPTTGDVKGMPDARDAERIAERLRARQNLSPDDDQWAQMEGLADSLVAQAQRSLLRVSGDMPGQLSSHESAAIEAVVQTRGRPAVRVLGDTLESILQYPESDIWDHLYQEYKTRVMTHTRAAAAVHVQDTLVPRLSWVHGSAVRISDRHVLTNRHVLISRNGGVSLVRRRPGTHEARLKGTYRVTLDFAHDDGPERPATFEVTGVPFLAADDDPVDAAILEIAPMDGVNPKVAPVLPVSNTDLFDADERLYVIGHPGKMTMVPPEVGIVFDMPDEKKRVSFGKLKELDSENVVHIVHDASTVGGFSGAAAHGFTETEIIALHYWGDSVNGNRAVAARALRAHADLNRFLP